MAADGPRVVVNLKNSCHAANAIVPAAYFSLKSLFTTAARAPVIIRRSEMRCEGEKRCRSTSARPTARPADKPRLIIVDPIASPPPMPSRHRPLTNRTVRLSAERRDIVGTAKEKHAPSRLTDRPTEASLPLPRPSWFSIPIQKLETWATLHACRLPMWRRGGP